VKEGEVKKKGMLLGLLWAVLAVQGCTGTMTGLRPTGSPPVIIGAWVPANGRYGDTVRIYLAASDPDGDMDRVAVQVTQPAMGTYPTNWIFLKSEYRKEFAGYLQWNTAGKSDTLAEGTPITLNLTVHDKGGNVSAEVLLDYQFLTGGPRVSPPPPPFNQANIPRIGRIDIELVNPMQPDID
jgi:hypothetical protein